jgi:anthranilate phosphoribosyltransferase
VAAALHELGSERAFVVHGERLDELPLDGSGVIYDVRPEGIERRPVSTDEVGLTEAETETFAGGTGEENAALIVRILEGEETGPRHDVVALNAGAALVVAGRATDLRSGVELAAETVASGAAHEQLERLRASAAETAAAEAEGAAEGEAAG